jgi:hypothetical protein
MKHYTHDIVKKLSSSENPKYLLGMSSSVALAFLQTKKVLKATGGGPGLELLEYDHVFKNFHHCEM